MKPSDPADDTRPISPDIRPSEVQNPRAVVAPVSMVPDFAFEGDSVFRDSLPPETREAVDAAARATHSHLEASADVPHGPHWPPCRGVSL